MREQLKALIVKWRAEAAHKDSFHATMGIGWKACADELEAALSPLPAEAAVGGEADRIAAKLEGVARLCRSGQPHFTGDLGAQMSVTATTLESAASLLRSQAVEIQKAQAQWREAESRVDDLQHLLARAQKAL